MTDEEIKALQDKIDEITAACAHKDAAIIEAQAAATHATEHAEALGKEIESLTSQLAAAQAAAAREKARADEGDAIMAQAADAVPEKLVQIRALRLVQKKEAAQAAVDAANAELAAMGR